MQKIISLFKRDYDGTRQVYDEIVPGAEWVADGDGVATIKYDGTCCLILDGTLYKRYDRKLSNRGKQIHFTRRGARQTTGLIPVELFKAAPPGWVPAEESPDHHTGHWPGWLPVGDDPGDKWHREAWELVGKSLHDGTWELVGPKINGNPHKLDGHTFYLHGISFVDMIGEDPPRDFDGLREWLADHTDEGIVWHHPDGRMVKIKRKDFGLGWPA